MSFAQGTRVAVEQLGFVEDELRVHCMGMGELLSTPVPGEALELRIRGARGLASSTIRELHAPAPGFLLAATERSLYLVSLAERQGQARPLAVREAAAAILHARRASSDAPQAGDCTRYVRLSAGYDASGGALVPGSVFASMEQPGGGPEKQDLGQCELLSRVVPGSPLRLATAEGRVLSTSDVTSVMSSDRHEFCVRTGNSCYVLRPLAKL